MKFLFPIVILISVMLAGCSSSRQQTMKEPVLVDTTVSDEDSTSSLPPSQPPPSPQIARLWTPHFIPTGYASGIMVEFTGVKKDKQLHAKYASIELKRHLPDTSQSLQLSSQREVPLSEIPQVVTLTTTINDMRQAFFKVPPGKYLFRQTKEWADVGYIRDVEVREGSYSVIRIEVVNPRAKTKQSLQSFEN